jgi:flagellar motor switch/type III secretory pathway protein FliN
MEKAEMTGEPMQLPGATGEKQWGATVWLPCELTLDLAIPTFRLGDLLRLRERDVIDTGWSQSKDIPLRANGKLIAWTEFEVLGDKLAVRLTELA